MKNTRLVVVESPYAGDVKANETYARACLRDCLRHGEAPLASHLLYTQPGVLDDKVPADRELGIDAGHAWIPQADAVVVYCDYGISDGMNRGIVVAHQHEVTVEIRYLGIPYISGATALEPEFTASDGTTRKVHYGTGKQPWDTILERGWGPAFAAGNALKYVRRHAAKNGADDLEKGRWYYRELAKLAAAERADVPHEASALLVLTRLYDELTPAELRLLCVRCST
jgi:Protein of unknwon function (DUF3310)